MTRCARERCGRARPDWLIRQAELGLRVDGEWFCSDACVAQEAARRLRDLRPVDGGPAAPFVRLGTVLRQQGTITAHQLDQALAAQHASGLRLGAQLQLLGFSDEPGVLRALAAQQNIRYLATVDVASVRQAPGSLTNDEVRGLGLVPFRADRVSLSVACTAPVRRVAVAALAALTNREVEPFLVTDSVFSRLMHAYGSAIDTRPQVAAAKDIEDGAARIAALTAAAGAVTVTQARLDPYTWVRVVSQDRTNTLLVPHHASLEDSAWLAATTPH